MPPQLSRCDVAAKAPHARERAPPRRVKSDGDVTLRAMGVESCDARSDPGLRHVTTPDAAAGVSVAVTDRNKSQRPVDILKTLREDTPRVAWGDRD